MCTLFRVFPQFGERELDSEVELREPAPDQQPVSHSPAAPPSRPGPGNPLYTACTFNAWRRLGNEAGPRPRSSSTSPPSAVHFSVLCDGPHSRPGPPVDSCWQRAAKYVLFPTSPLLVRPAFTQSACC